MSWLKDAGTLYCQEGQAVRWSHMASFHFKEFKRFMKEPSDSPRGVCPPLLFGTARA